MDTALVIYHSKPSHSPNKICKYCHESGNILLDCSIRHCKSCQKIGASHYEKDCPYKGKQFTLKDAPPKSNPFSTTGTNNNSSAQANIE